MLFSTTSLITLLASTSLASATFTRGNKFSWGCDQDTKNHAPAPVKNDCSGKGSFFTSFGGKAVCCSDKTRGKPPKDDSCPHGWAYNGRAGCCIPPKEVCDRDCGEGYGFNKNKMGCEPHQPNKCGKGKWWHERSKECCNDNPGPDKGDCPKDRSCPKGWHWSKSGKRCKPDKPRSPEPDCDDWNEHHGCCGGPPPPQQTGGHGPPKPPTYPTTPGPPGHPAPPPPGHPAPPPPGHPAPPPPGGGHGGNGGHGGKGGKRDIDLRRSVQIAFPQSETDKLYCPGRLHACVGGEWAYECLDFATELESCGGCSSTGEGQDCTKIPHAGSVGCELGVCAIYTCQSGFVSNGTACALP